VSGRRPPPSTPDYTSGSATINFSRSQEAGAISRTACK